MRLGLGLSLTAARGGGGVTDSLGNSYVVGDFTPGDGLTITSVNLVADVWEVTMTDGSTSRTGSFTPAEMVSIQSGAEIGKLAAATVVAGTATVSLWFFSAVPAEFEYQGYVGATQNPIWNSETFDATIEPNYEFSEIGFIITPNVGSPFTVIGQAQALATVTDNAGADLVQTDVNIGGVLWDFIHYTTPGTFVITTTGGYLEIELVAAGGEGARANFGSAGAGAAGERKVWTGIVSAGTHTIVVPAGQTPLALGGTNVEGRKGDPASFDAIAAEGGGGGVGNGGKLSSANGGSGGGARINDPNNRGFATSSGVTGYDGGLGNVNSSGGGGGGMGGAGGNSSGTVGGAGGAGIDSLFTGTSVPMCEGGSGAGNTAGGAGNARGGGLGGANNQSGTDATTVGSGGGASRRDGTNTRPGVGFKGKVVLKLRAA
jgi:hypothetical protein